MEGTVYDRLMTHFSTLGMGYPPRDVFLDILRESFSPEEAEVLLLLPTRVAPLQTVSAAEAARSRGLDAASVAEMLDRVANRNLIYRGKTAAGEVGYALLQVGFGFPQTFFWKGEDTPHARKMNQLIGKYFSREVTRDSYSSSETKPYRYVPVERTIQKDKQAVYPLHAMEQVINGATSFAVAHCPCRVSMRLRDRPCEHPEEVCLKFDEMAEYAIERELARRITRDEAREIIQLSAREGLVHFVDNAGSGVKHNCNCCGCACWNVGTIRRRKVPRDTLMAAYFLRETDPDRCTGCGDCVEICPVQAVTAEDGRVAVDLEWCIGCGVCATRCGFDACAMIHREDRGEVPGEFGALHRDILREKVTKTG